MRTPKSPPRAARRRRQAAAVNAAGGGTATTATTDFTGNGYEVTVKKSDGSTVEIHLDNSFTVVDGHGGRLGHGAFNGPAPGTAAHESRPAPVIAGAIARTTRPGLTKRRAELSNQPPGE